MKDTPAPTDTEARWQRWAAQTRAWGPPGNERLTTSVGLVLLVLLGIETLTALALSSYLPEHIFLGLLLIPPVALKLTTTGWRFVRYYTNSRPYRLEGPPRLLLRLLAPLLVLSTLTLFGSGVALIIRGTRRWPPAPIARGQLRGLGCADRDPHPRVPDPGATGRASGLGPPRGPRLWRETVAAAPRCWAPSSPA